MLMLITPWSFRRALTFSAFMLCGLAVAARPAVTDLSRIDRVVVEKSTGQATLFLIVDLPLEDGLTKRRVIRKLNLYAAVENYESGFRKLPLPGRFGYSSTIRQRPTHLAPVCLSKLRVTAAN